MIKEIVLKELNQQINEELYSAYLYYAMAADCESKGLSGFAHWLKMQAEEETHHAFSLYDYINKRGSKVQLAAIAAPPESWENPLAVFKEICEHEAHITGRVNQILKVARDNLDNATEEFIKWFVAEQVEEEASVGEVYQKLKMFGNSMDNLYLIDQEMATRPKPGGVTNE